MRQEILDHRISDCEKADNKQTYRQFIKSSEKEFGIKEAAIEKMTNHELRNYIMFLSELWTK
jgi:hypothetical protein